MKCPCGCPVDMHGDFGGHWDASNKTCKCYFRKYDAYRASQRAAAIAHLREFVENETWISTKGVRMPAPGTKAFSEFMAQIKFIVAAYRAIGVLPGKERKP